MEWQRILRRRRLARIGDLVLDDVTCVGGSARWSPVEPDEGWAVVLVRAGAFRREADGRAAFLDPSRGYLSREGTEERFAFTAGGGQRCTVIGLTAELYDAHALAAASDWLLAPPTRFDLRHRSLLAATTRGVDGFEAAERVLRLLGSLGPAPEAAASRRPATREAHGRLVASVQEALATEHLSAGLDELAARVGASAHHLSRVFRQVTGRTLTDYRNELRVRRVLQDLSEGSSAGLSTLAAAYGFADQAHLCRVVKQYAGRTPSELRRELSMNLQAGATLGGRP
ncbi:helix-turn-helix transcriptional regulator [Nonomuraea sp. NPDC050310]|uniref:helix-turn-helix transcriptional regulator n=1 Tax=Nonomuraea sp. NPDC050310 TaxID=3154935 RepID=UPI0033DC72D4